MLRILRKIVTVFVLLSTFIGCSLPVTPPTSFYVLEPGLDSSSASENMLKKPAVGIGPLTIPKMLDRKQLVTREVNNKVALAELHQWVEPLSDNIAHVITQNVASQQNRFIARSYPWSAYGSVNYRVIIDIDRFDSGPGQVLYFAARWSVMNEKNHQILMNRQTRIEKALPESGYAPLVKTMNIVLLDFSRDIAKALDQIKQVHNN